MHSGHNNPNACSPSVQGPLKLWTWLGRFIETFASQKILFIVYLSNPQSSEIFRLTKGNMENEWGKNWGLFFTSRQVHVMNESLGTGKAEVWPCEPCSAWKTNSQLVSKSWQSHLSLRSRACHIQHSVYWNPQEDRQQRAVWRPPPTRAIIVPLLGLSQQASLIFR